MFRLNPLVPILVVLAALTPATTARAAPDAARIMGHVTALAGTMGPRPTGSLADARAVAYVQREMEAAGLEVSLQEVTRIEEANGERTLRAWNVIGRLAGATPDTILVAAHHDSAGTAVPGANDDASGLAVLLEIARAVAVRPRLSTYLFISFGAEEEGLLGSKRFVQDADLSRVRAVIALELLGRGEILAGPVPEAPPRWAQEALLRAKRETGVSTVSTRPIWTLVPRFMNLPFSSDHEPFLKKGIPAFLLLGTFPGWTYHTSEDSIERIDPAALGRAAIVLDRLLRNLELSPPAPSRDRSYLPLSLFGRGLIVPGAVLGAAAWAAIILTGLLGALNLSRVVSPRAWFETFRVLVVAGASAAIGISGMFVSTMIMQRIQGARFPWMAHQTLHLAQGLAFTIACGWLGLRLFRMIKPTIEPGPYLALALILPAAYATAGLAYGRPDAAGLLAAPALGFLASLLTTRIARKLALGLAGAVPFFMLLSREDYRAAIDLGGLVIPGWILFAGMFAIVFPFVLFVAHVACFHDCLQSSAWRRLSSRWVGGGALAVAVVLLGVAGFLPAYDQDHRPIVRMQQSVDLQERRATATLRSAEWLRGVRLKGRVPILFDAAETIEQVYVPYRDGPIAFDASAVTAPEGDALGVACTVRLDSPALPATVSYLFTSRTGFRVRGRDGTLRRTYAFTEVRPAEDGPRTFHLLVPGDGDLAVSLRADFDGDIMGIEPEAAGRVFVSRGRVVGSRRLLGATAPAPPGGPAGASR